MTVNFVQRLLVQALLFLAIQMVSLFNAMDDGPVDYQVVERDRPDMPL